MAFTIISDVVPPASRAFALAINNVVFFTASLIVTVLNAFVLPYIPGAYPEDDDYQIFKTSLLCASIFIACGCICSFFVKESCPIVLLKKKYKENGKEYVPPKDNEISWGEAFKFIFGTPHMLMLFFAYIFGFGTSVLNLNVSSAMVSKYLLIRQSIDAYVLVSICALVGISIMLLFTTTLYKICLKKFGDIRMLIVILIFACLTSVLRSTPSPISKVQVAISAIFNQFGNALTDAPFITFASMQTTPRSRGKVLGVFMIGNSIARAALSAIGGSLLDWHWRDSQMIFIYFTIVSILFLCFVRQPAIKIK